MSRPRRTVLLAALALVVPIHAFAGEVAPAPEPTISDLGVSASLDSCGLMETQIVCQFSVSYATLPNATSYTASMTRPDGSTTNLGPIPAGGTTLTVPYAGNGTYSIRVTAYGHVDAPGGDAEVIATEVAASISDAPAKPRVAQGPVRSEVTTRETPGVGEESGDVREAPEPACAQQRQRVEDASAQATASAEQVPAGDEQADPAAQQSAAAAAPESEPQAADAGATEPVPAPAPGGCTTP